MDIYNMCLANKRMRSIAHNPCLDKIKWRGVISQSIRYPNVSKRDKIIADYRSYPRGGWMPTVGRKAPESLVFCWTSSSLISQFTDLGRLRLPLRSYVRWLPTRALHFIFIRNLARYGWRYGRNACNGYSARRGIIIFLFSVSTFVVVFGWSKISKFLGRFQRTRMAYSGRIVCRTINAFAPPCADYSEHPRCEP